MSEETYLAMPCFGIWVDELLVGFLRYNPEVNHLSSLYVTPAYRGRGLATWTFQQLEINSLYILRANHKAIALYQRLGLEINEAYPIGGILGVAMTR